MNFLYNNEAYQANIPKYNHWWEGNKEIYLSSAFYRDHWPDEKVFNLLKEKVLSFSRDGKTSYYSRDDISRGNREDMISSCKINKNEIEKLI